MGFNVFRIFLLSMLAEAADHPPVMTAFQGAVETLMVVVLQATGSLRC